MNEKIGTYAAWMKQLDAVTSGKAGVNLRDLPVQELHAAFAAGLTPADAFDLHLRPKLVNLGFHLEIADLFEDAQALGRDHYAPHCMAEAGLEYLTDEDLYLALVDIDEAERERAIDAAL